MMAYRAAPAERREKMKVTDVQIFGSALASVTCRIDDVACDAMVSHGVPEVWTTHPQQLVAKGAEVPAEIVEALEEARRESAEYHRIARAAFAGESAAPSRAVSFDDFNAGRHGAE